MNTATKFKPNEKQQECIDNIEGKYLVLAGPGTGKTYTIIQRIKSMIERKINPEKILCLTFSDAATNEMRTRLEKELNRADFGVNIYTYHGFCNEIISENLADFELPNNFKVITSAMSNQLLKECIDEIQSDVYRTKRNDPYYFITEIKNGINEIKSNRLDKDKYFYNLENNQDWIPELNTLKNELKEKTEKGQKITKKLLTSIETSEKKIAKAKELWKFYELYTSKMEEQHYVDFNDMINFVLEKFETESAFLSKIANNYEYILVDEYQDTNKNQNEIVFNLTESLDSQNVFVVGDDDQIIFTFQGAKLDTIEKFLIKFPDTRVICLTENMRSTQSILDTARKIVEQDLKRLETNSNFAKFNITKKLVAKNTDIISKDKQVRFYKYADILQEYQEIVDEIDTLINSENCPKDENGNKKLSEIAILAKTNGELTTFSELLKERNIPSELKEGKSIFEIKSSTVLYYYLQLLTNPELHSDKFFKLVLSEPFNIHPKDFEQIYEQKSKYLSFVDAVKAINPDEYIDKAKIEKFIQTFEYLSRYKTNETLKNTILEVGAKTGIFNYYLNSEINKVENIAGLKKITDESVDFSSTYKRISLEDFIEYIDICINDEIEIKTDKAPLTLNAIQLSTYHSAKGREFEYVYMPNLLREKWESDRSSMKPIIPLSPSEYKTEEELKELKISDKIKLMYVGITRAKHTLRLSCPKSVEGKIKTPTSFVLNIEGNLEQEKEPFTYDIDSYWKERTKSLLKRSYDYQKDFCEIVDKKLNGKYFSPTSINTYLKCPRQYLYNYILELGAKDGNPDSMSYGSAIHKACEFAVKFAIENGKYPSSEVFINQFKKELQTLPMSTIEQRKIHIERGEKALQEYYPQLCATPISNLFKAEEKITLELDGVKFKGIIDRIDKNDDGSYTIYDYKTGSAKSEKIICPNGDHEDYYNQIGLYKYYFEKATNEKVKNTTFIYPEDFTNNLTLELSEENCLEIEEKFKSAIQKIRDYEFAPTYDKNACKWCIYKDFCNMEQV